MAHRPLEITDEMVLQVTYDSPVSWQEYDKLDCPTRAMFRQLFENLHAANVTGSRRATRDWLAVTSICIAKPARSSSDA